MTCPLCGGAHEAHRSCPSAEPGSRVGQVVANKYRIVRHIASGGMATVYEASHIDIGRPFALKFLHQELRDDPTFLSRFKNEAAAAGALESEHIATVVDFGVQDDATPYIVMELLRGEDLAQRLERDPLVHPETAIHILLQACAGLSVAHSAGVIHRDLKPGNVFLCSKEGDPPLVKLLDFGVARVVGAGPSEQTQIGTVLGTPWYMSPEQARGQRELDARTDIYSLGVVLYEMLCGEKPHLADNTNALLHRIATSPAQSLYSRCPSLSERLAAVVDRALAVDPSQRYASALDFADALRPFTHGAREPHEDAAEAPDTSPTPSDPTAAHFAPTRAERRKPAADTTSPVVESEAEDAPEIPLNQSSFGVWLSFGAAALLLVAVFAWGWNRRTPSAKPAPSGESAAAAPAPAPEVATETPTRPSSAPSGARMPAAATGAVSAAASAARGWIRVTAMPAGRVFIDGRAVGMTPIVSAPLRPGSHRVVVVHPERGKLSRVTTVGAGETKVLSFHFEPPELPAPTPSAKPVNCNPDYTVDRDGIRRLKPECLTRAGPLD